MTTLYQQRLSNSGILEMLQLNQKRYFNISTSKNLLAVYGQQLFVWHDIRSCFLTVEIADKEEKCKVIVLTDPPIFEVESLSFNSTGSLLAISGKNGVMIFEVPWRYGKFTTSSKNEDSFLGRSWSLAEHFFVCSNRISVVQASWHPGSHSHTHLTVLSTDNYIRIYDVTDPQTPRQVISLGPSAKSSYLSSETKVSFSTCLGENVVSFDYGKASSQMKRGDSQSEEVTVWPIYLLHGNGDIYILRAPMKKERFGSRMEGPLAMYPSAEDNYGFDACSLLCLGNSGLVMATTNGILYHCLLLEEGEDSVLHVFERVELPLTLGEGEVDGHPLRLYPDVTHRSKYHCTHTTGVHSVVVPFLQAMEDYVDEGELESEPSIVEHLLCTQPFSGQEAVPVLGLDTALHNAGVTMVVLLASWEFVCLPLVSSFHWHAPPLLSEEQRKQSSFEHCVDELLKRPICSPLLKSCPPSDTQQWLDMVCTLTSHFREDYIQRLEPAFGLLRKRMTLLTLQKEYQLKAIEKCAREKEELESGVERLTQKYKTAEANQKAILKRIASALQDIQKQLPRLSSSEVMMKEKLLSYQDTLKTYEVTLSQIKKKLAHQSNKRKETAVADLSLSFSGISLTETQLGHVKEILALEGDSVSDLVKSVTSLKKEMRL